MKKLLGIRQQVRNTKLGTGGKTGTGDMVQVATGNKVQIQETKCRYWKQDIGTGDKVYRYRR